MSLEAGRELDALVAEKVMGLADICHDDGLDHFHEGEWCYTCRGMVLPPYSTEMAAAWQVVNRLMVLGFLFALWNKGHGFVACFSSDDPNYWLESIESGPASTDTVQADSAPLAICLAALKAVGVEVPDA